jgi:hypothetical protein
MVTSEMVEPFLDGLNLDQAIQAKRVYICNMKVLSDILCKSNRIVSVTSIIIIIIIIIKNE